MQSPQIPSERRTGRRLQIWVVALFYEIEKWSEQQFSKRNNDRPHLKWGYSFNSVNIKLRISKMLKIEIGRSKSHQPHLKGGHGGGLQVKALLASLAVREKKPQHSHLWRFVFYFWNEMTFFNCSFHSFFFYLRLSLLCHESTNEVKGAYFVIANIINQVL